MRDYFMRDLPEFPPLELTDYLVKDLGVCYEVTRNPLLLRLNLYWLLEIQVKKLNSVYYPDKFKTSKGSHNVLKSIYLFSDYVPDLWDFIDRLNKDSVTMGRLSAIQNFDYVSARYSGALEVFRADLPLVEDLFELYWILSNHLKQLSFS